MRGPPSARGWLRAAWGCADVLVLLVAVSLPRSVALCRVELVEAAEPSAWRAFPVLDGRARATVLPDSALCPESAVAIRGWLAPRAATRMEASDAWLRYNPAHGTVVVAGPPRFDQAPDERFLAAFVRSEQSRIALVSRGRAAWLATLGLALAALLVALAIAHQRLRHRGQSPHLTRHAALVATDPYRLPRSSDAEPLGVKPREGPTETQARRAVRAVRRGLAAALGVLAVGLLVECYVVVREITHVLF